MPERLQKVLANNGIASRREIEKWIDAGEVFVDGSPCEIGQRITGQEKIVIRGNPIQLSFLVQSSILIYHKQCGEVVSRSDPQKRPIVFENLPRLETGRWVSIGRLDINTSGLLLLTTDGELANKLMHPRYEIEREYKVRVHGKITDSILNNLQSGVLLDDGLAKFDVLEILDGRGTNTWCTVILKEGRNREVRRMWESQGLSVSRLIRIRFGSISLPRDLKPGKWLEHPSTDVAKLYKLVR